MQKNKKGFSIVIGMGLTILILLMSYYLLSYIIPFGKNVKGIEQSSSAYYNAYAGIEETLLKVKTRPSLTTEFSKSMISASQTGISYNTISSGGVLPYPGKGNSEYDKNNSIISLSNPIQLEIGNSTLILGTNNYIDNFRLVFKVPSFTGGTLTLTGGNTPIINWSISSSTNTLNSSGSQIIANNIKNSDVSITYDTSSNISLKDKPGVDLFGIGKTYGDFYIDNCIGAGSGCILKLSVINELKTTNGVNIPYLEYRINSQRALPLYYTTISTSGKSYGFQKNLEVQVPQQTTNQAFDFTIFQ